MGTPWEVAWSRMSAEDKRKHEELVAAIKEAEKRGPVPKDEPYDPKYWHGVGVQGPQ